MTTLLEEGPAPPSRDANPFATCWTRPGALPPLLPAGEPLGRLVERLALQGWLGQIVGPHGSGKSTLLRRLAPLLAEAGRRPFTVRIDTPGGGRLLSARLTEGSEEGDAVALLEGFERLGYAARLGVLRRCRRHGAGWVATTHRRAALWPERLPVLAQMAPTEETLITLFDRLTARRETPVTRREALASYARHGGDLRRVWFDLYDLHERARGAARTVVCWTT